MATPPPRSSNASRYLIVLILGLLIGAIGSVMLYRSWQDRQDKFPTAIMEVIAKQYGLLKKTADANQCTQADITPRIVALRAMANDLELAYPEAAKDQRFGSHASQMRAVLDETMANPPGDCASLKTLLGKLGQNCQDCHKDFK
ncbi:MAG: cytochrome c [Xanthomonadaceae bacterium]|jgi:cytochrome c556|nr:cytochrome c [Xanthomonadaceae bacterium]